jgi:hypothetical protein
MKMAVFWDFAPCSMVEIDQRFRGAYCLHHQGGVTVGKFLPDYMVQHPDGSHFHIHHRENLKSHKV